MKRLLVVTLVALLLIPIQANASDNGPVTVTGQVCRAHFTCAWPGAQPMPGVTLRWVSFYDLSVMETATDANGYYSIVLPHAHEWEATVRDLEPGVRCPTWRHTFHEGDEVQHDFVCYNVPTVPWRLWLPWVRLFRG